MKVKITELKKRILNSLINRGLSDKDAKVVAEPLVEAELRGKKTHGIGKLFTLENAIQKREGKPEVIKDKFNYTLINAHKELGYITAEFATDILINKAKQYDNAMVGVINSYYYSMAGPYARKVAIAGFIGIILNNGGPAAVAPFGSSTPLLGTNPIAISIPTEAEPIVLDMATSEKTWGEINLAKIEKRNLQEKTFFDRNGNFTTNPIDAEAIIPFGGTKGYGLNFIFEILTGALVGTKMGLQIQNGYDLGFFFIAVSPTMFTTREEFIKHVAVLTNEIKQSRKLPGIAEIYLPGEQSDRRLKTALDSGYVEINEETWQKLEVFSKGIDIKSPPKSPPSR